MTSLNAIAQEQISRLHRDSIDTRSAIAHLLRTAARKRVILTAGVSRTASVRRCVLQGIDENRLLISGHDFLPTQGRHYYFTLLLDDESYFFSARLQDIQEGLLEFEFPRAVFRAERRDACRVPPAAFGFDASAQILLDDRPRASVLDASRDGLGIGLPLAVAESLPGTFELEVPTSSGGRSRLYAEVRNRRRGTERDACLGLSVSSVPSRSDVGMESGHPVFQDRLMWSRFALASRTVAVGVDRVWRQIAPGRRPWTTERVRFQNQRGQDLTGIVNSIGVTRGAPAILIPPAWGKTKETLLPLALSLVETCKRAGLAVTVLRFDGANRRGESFIDEECRVPGEEYRRFRFSQAVDDLHSAIRFLREDDQFRAPRFVIVSFSLSAIEARRVVAEASPQEVVGWIPVVGMVDLQSGLRAVSGGVDYAEGILRGVRFGRHELVGVLADMDFTGRDALEAGLVFKEDARRDLARVQVPITWIHGEHDSWIDVNRAREVLLAGTSRNRRIIQVPTGHQLRTSHEALKTFELVAVEAVRMLWSRNVTPRSPSLRLIDRIREAERRRGRDGNDVDLRAFWHDYLLGRDRSVGMDLLIATSAYQSFMRRQIEFLRIGPSTRVLDLGSGNAGFLRTAAESSHGPGLLVSVDFISDALKRSKSRYGARLGSAFVQADLDSVAAVPFKTSSFDAVLASLLLSYLRNPLELLHEARRIVRPGGRIVLSSLRRDADISSIYSAGIAELVAAGAEEMAIGEGTSFAEMQRSFLNEAAKLLDLEERGLFRFFDEDELRSLARDAGLRVWRIERGLGDPPQAIVLVAEAPH